MSRVIHFPRPQSAHHAPAQSQRRFASSRAVFALMLREMSTSYGRSPGGYIWAVLEPAAAIALLTGIFSIGFLAPPLGNDFALFYATGLLPFLMFNHVAASVGSAINFSKALLTYPRVTFVDAIMARFCLHVLTQCIVFLLIMTGIFWIAAASLHVDLVIVLHAIALTAGLALGIGTLNCFLLSMFPMWQRIWSVITRPLFLVSGIVFILEIVPQPYRDYLWYNPLIHVVSIMRTGFYAGYDAAWASDLYVTSISAISLALGLVFLRRYHLEILHR